jgi:glycosyltransferase involved in cell wall biosynthesis
MENKKDHNKVIVSIIMPTYNRVNTMGLAIESVLKQGFKDWELIVVDNESTDGTGQRIKEFDDSRIKYHFVKKSLRKGITEYLNYGIKKSLGKYIARLDDDDEWADEKKLQKQVNHLDTNPECVIVGGGVIVVDENRNEIYRFYKREKDFQIRKYALIANPFWHNTVLYRKNIVEEIGFYNDYRFVEDWDLWLRLGRVGKFYNFQEHFSLYMNAGQNLSVANQTLAAKTILKLIKKYKYEYPNYNLAVLLNSMQYLFSLLPSFIKRNTQDFFFYVKRNFF